MKHSRGEHSDRTTERKKGFEPYFARGPVSSPRLSPVYTPVDSERETEADPRRWGTKEGCVRGTKGKSDLGRWNAVGGRYPLNTGHEAKRGPAALHPCPGWLRRESGDY